VEEEEQFENSVNQRNDIAEWREEGFWRSRVRRRKQNGRQSNLARLAMRTSARLASGGTYSRISDGKGKVSKGTDRGWFRSGPLLLNNRTVASGGGGGDGEASRE